MPHNLNQKYDEQKYTSYCYSYQLENRIQKKATDACKTTTELEKNPICPYNTCLDNSFFLFFNSINLYKLCIMRTNNMFINLHLHFVFPPSIQLQEVRNAHLHLLYLYVLKLNNKLSVVYIF